MIEIMQGDIIKFANNKTPFLVTTKNAVINSLDMFHICPILNIPDGPLHIMIHGRNGTTGTAICEQMKLIDPEVRSFNKVDSIPYDEVMNISDAIQGMLEYL